MWHLKGLIEESKDESDLKSNFYDEQYQIVQ